MAIFLKIAEKSGSRAGVLHQPLAAGPRGSPGLPGYLTTPRSVESLQAAAVLEREVIVLSDNSGVTSS